MEVNQNVLDLLTHIQEQQQKQLLQDQQHLKLVPVEQQDDTTETSPASMEKKVDESINYDPEIMIDLIRDEPCLWNTQCRSYKEAGKKKNAWNNIANVFIDKDGKFSY